MIESKWKVYTDQDLPILLDNLESYKPPYSIELACGSDLMAPHDKWIHSDCAIHETHEGQLHIEMFCYSWNIPLPAESVEHIFAKGFWEHLSYNEAERTLKEWNRILITGGLITINYPPIDHAIHMLTQKHADWQWFLRALYGWQFQERDTHRSGWTEDWMRQFIAKFPEFEIQEIFWGDSRATDGVPLRAEFDPYVTVGAHQWAIIRKK